MNRLVAVVAVAIALSGCDQSKHEPSKPRGVIAIDAIPSGVNGGGIIQVPSTHCDANRLYVGMDSLSLTEICGLPSKIHADKIQWLHEQWVYGGGVYVYVEDGLVKSFQWSYP